MLFSIQILIKKVFKKLIFAAFGKILVLANAFFYSITFLKKYLKKIGFSSFWQDLGFGECFFYSNPNQKSIENLIFRAFGKSFGFGECFLHEVIAEFVLPKKYLPELEKYYLYFFQYSMYVSVFLNSWNALKIMRFPIPYSMYADSVI